MKIGIIVYSHTGNTDSIVQTLQNALMTDKKSVVIERIEVTPDEPGAEKVTLFQSPDLKPYDTLIFASPVHGFQVSKAMATYLNSQTTLAGKRVILLVTHFFPFAWMGGKSSIAQMRKICEAKGANVLTTAIIDWKNRKREQEIKAMTDSIVRIL